MGEEVKRSAAPAAPAPDPEWIRGQCPKCGAAVVSNCYYQGGRGYVLLWECWNALGEPEVRTCDWRKVL